RYLRRGRIKISRCRIFRLLISRSYKKSDFSIHFDYVSRGVNYNAGDTLDRDTRYIGHQTLVLVCEIKAALCMILRKRECNYKSHENFLNGLVPFTCFGTNGVFSSSTADYK